MRHLSRVLLVVCVSLILAACGNTNVVPTAISLPTAVPTATPAPTNTPQAVTNETLEQARPVMLRVVNAAADSPALNVFAGFSAIATNLVYTQFTEPTSFDSGKYTLKVETSGSASNDKPLLESDLDLPGGQSLILLITGSGTQLTLTLLPENNEPLKATENIIRVINGLSDNSAIDLKSGDTDLVSGLNAENVAFSPVVPAGKADLIFQIGGTTVPYSTNLKELTNTTLIVAGTAAKASFIQFASAAPKRISVRAINASADITKIDVYLDDDLLNSGLDYGRPGERRNFASGQHTARIYAAGADRNTVEPLTGQVVSLVDSDNFAIMLLGSASQLTVLSFPEDLSPTPAGQTRVAFLNTVPTLSDIDVIATDAAMPNIPRLFFGQAPSLMNVPSGTYAFSMGAPNNQNIRVTVEQVRNVQFETGYSYLYLVTGRIDDKPLILSDKVDTVDTSANSNTLPSGQGASIRFINALENQTLDFAINGTVALTGLKYSEGSAIIPVHDQTATITVNTSGQTNSLGQQDTTFEAGSRYTIVAYKADNGVGILVINDDNLIFDGSSPHIRLINISAQEDSSLGLAFSEASDKPNPTVEPVTVTPEATADAVQPNEVFTLPYGVQKLVSNIGPGSPSSVILMPVATFDLEVIDSINNRLAFTLPKVALIAGIHVDVIAFQQVNSSNISAFAVIYPKPQG